MPEGEAAGQARKRAGVSRELAAFPMGAVIELGGRRARVVAVLPPDDRRDYGLVVVEVLVRGLVPETTCFPVTEAGPELRVPAGWREGEGGGESAEDSP